MKVIMFCLFEKGVDSALGYILRMHFLGHDKEMDLLYLAYPPSCVVYNNLMRVG